MRLAANSMSADDMSDHKVLTKLATEANDLKMDEVARTLYQVKPGDEIQESLAKLGAMLQKELVKTYAFLVNKKEKEEDVTKFTKKGLQVMIMNRLKQLMPVGCKKCNNMYRNCREEAPQVTCRMCGIGACHHFKKARCHHGLSGKQSFGGVEKCPFRHPQICGKLLRNGDRGRGGCRGQQDGCTKYHQVKMCFSSMNTRKCAHKECKNGYHVKGTVIQKKDEKEAEKKDVEQRPKIKPWEKEKSVVEKQW